MKKCRFILLVSFLYLVLPSISGPISAPSLLPGKSIGLLKLGATRKEVRRIMGQPAYSIPQGGLGPYEKEIYSPPQWLKKSWFIEVDYQRGKVVQLATNFEQFTTAQGLSIHSTFGLIRRKLGKGELSTMPNPIPPFTVRFLTYTKYGLTFQWAGPVRKRAREVAEYEVPTRLIVHPVGKKPLIESFDPSETAIIDYSSPDNR